MPRTEARLTPHDWPPALHVACRDAEFDEALRLAGCDPATFQFDMDAGDTADDMLAELARGSGDALFDSLWPHRCPCERHPQGCSKRKAGQRRVTVVIHPPIVAGDGVLEAIPAPRVVTATGHEEHGPDVLEEAG